MLCCIRCYHKLYNWITPFFYSDIPVVKYDTIIYSNLITDKLTLDSKHEYIEKYRIVDTYRADYERLTYTEQFIILHQKVNPPWLWIGGTKNGVIIDMTDKLNKYVVINNYISTKVLEIVDPDITDWKYLDLSLNEVKFPISGIVIKE